MNFISKHRAAFKKFGLILLSAAAIFATTRLTLAYETITNASTAAFVFLIIVLLSAFFGDIFVSITTSVVATLCFNYFYLPPLGTFFIAAFSDWISLTAFLLTAVVISRLTSSALENRAKARLLDQTLAQLKEFGAGLLSLPSSQISLSGIAGETMRIFSLEYCSIHVYGDGKWNNFTGAAASNIPQEIQDRLILLKDHPTKVMELAEERDLDVTYMPVKQGMKTLALLVVKSSTLTPNAIGTMANMIGIRLIMGVSDTER
jgi:two-component system sensor histidine kinase KdpD